MTEQDQADRMAAIDREIDQQNNLMWRAHGRAREIPVEKLDGDCAREVARTARDAHARLDQLWRERAEIDRDGTRLLEIRDLFDHWAITDDDDKAAALKAEFDEIMQRRPDLRPQPVTVGRGVPADDADDLPF
jgi:hypothetical protein